MLTHTTVADEEGNVESRVWSLALVVLHLYAVFLSFQRNQGISIGPLLLAMLLPEPYILYSFAVKAK